MDNIKILYEDNHILVVVKPINMLSQSDKTKDLDLLTNLKQYLKEKYQKPGNVYLGLVHRLDRPTGGVMVFAKTSKAANRLSKQIQNHEFKKTYLAVLHGRVLNENTFIDYLEKKENKSIISSYENGKYAELSYHLLNYHKKLDLSLVEVHLKTGRKHQIRLQFASRGNPLYGDSKYGSDKNQNLGLYAVKLEFFHPTKKNYITFESIPNHLPFSLFF